MLRWWRRIKGSHSLPVAAAAKSNQIICNSSQQINNELDIRIPQLPLTVLAHSLNLSKNHFEFEHPILNYRPFFFFGNQPIQKKKGKKKPMYIVQACKTLKLVSQQACTSSNPRAKALPMHPINYSRLCLFILQVCFYTSGLRE